jgi:hypothetical protein
MRAAAILCAGWIGVIQASAYAATAELQPDEAALACHARAGHELGRRFGETPRPARYLARTRVPDGWRVLGVYLVGTGNDERRFDVACHVTRAGVDLDIRGE